MKVAFRVDSGTEIGAGHLSRCLTIANELISNGISECHFIQKSHKGRFASIIKDNGFFIKELKLEFTPDYHSGDYKQWVAGSIINDAKLTLAYLKENGFASSDWIIIDHYGLSYEYEKLIATSKINIGVIDDLANRVHYCQFLLDQTCDRHPSEYKDLVSNNTDLMTGQNFCILRPEFLTLRKASLKKRKDFKTIKNILINFGSTDPTNVTSKIIEALTLLPNSNNLKISVVIGSSSSFIKNIKNSIDKSSCKINLIIDASNMSELMYKADVAIGAAGSTTWERCTLGLPTIMVKTAENQNTVIERVLKFGVAVFHDLHHKEQANELQRHLSYIHNNYSDISKKCSDLIQGNGVKRVIDRISRKDIK